MKANTEYKKRLGSIWLMILVLAILCITPVSAISYINPVTNSHAYTQSSTSNVNDWEGYKIKLTNSTFDKRTFQVNVKSGVNATVVGIWDVGTSNTNTTTGVCLTQVANATIVNNVANFTTILPSLNRSHYYVIASGIPNRILYKRYYSTSQSCNKVNTDVNWISRAHDNGTFGCFAMGTGCNYYNIESIRTADYINYFNILSPANNSESLKAVNFSATLRAITTYKNATLYIDNVKNQTKTITGYKVSFTKNLNYSDDHIWKIKVCSNGNVCSNSTKRNLTTGKVKTVAESYDTETIEGDTETISINISTDSFQVSEANLIYNNTIYTGTITNTAGYNYTLSRTLSIPLVPSDVNKTFYWNVVLEDSSEYNSTHHNQTIRNFAIDDCDVNTIIIMNLTLRDEESQTKLNGTYWNSSIETDIDIYSIGGDSPIIEYYNNFTKINPITICINDSLNSSDYEFYSQIKYSTSQRETEFYYIQNYTLNNDTIPQTINLYDLLSEDSQEFKITYKDDSFLAVEDALLQIQRKYISEGVFKTVEIPKTDNKGEAIAHLVPSNVIYTIVVTKYGEVLATFDNIQAICQNPTLETCEINLNSFSTSIEPEDFTVGDDFSFTLTFNRTSRKITSIFSVPSGATATTLLNVTLFDNIGKTQACSDTLTSSSGTLTCIVPTALGNGSVIAQIKKGSVIVGQAFINLKQTPSDLYGNNLVFIGLFLMLTLVGIGLNDNPMITGIFLIIGVILSVLLNIIGTGTSSFIGAGATFLWLVIAVLIVLVKGARRS